MIEYDLHMHTTFCDGKNTPEEIVLYAIDKGFSAIGFSAVEENVEIYLQYVNVSAENSKLEVVSGRGETAFSAIHDIKTKLNITPLKILFIITFLLSSIKHSFNL